MTEKQIRESIEAIRKAVSTMFELQQSHGRTINSIISALESQISINRFVGDRLDEIFKTIMERGKGDGRRTLQADTRRVAKVQQVDKA